MGAALTRLMVNHMILRKRLAYRILWVLTIAVPLIRSSQADFIRLKAGYDCGDCELPANEESELSWGPVTATVQVSLQVSNHVCAIGEPVTATVVMRNATERSVGYPMQFPVRDFGFTIRDSKGREIPLVQSVTNRGGFAVTATRDRQPHEDMGGNVNADSGVRLEPQRVLRAHFSLEKTFDLARPGEYLVTAGYRIPGTTNLVYAVSNTVTVEVIGASSVGPKKH